MGAIGRRREFKKEDHIQDDKERKIKREVKKKENGGKVTHLVGKRF